MLTSPRVTAYISAVCPPQGGNLSCQSRRTGEDEALSQREDELQEVKKTRCHRHLQSHRKDIDSLQRVAKQCLIEVQKTILGDKFRLDTAHKIPRGEGITSNLCMSRRPKALCGTRDISLRTAIALKSRARMPPRRPLLIALISVSSCAAVSDYT